MKRRLILTALLSAAVVPLTVLATAPSTGAPSTAGTAAGSAKSPKSDEVLVHLTTKLGEPRHYCLDIPGYPATGNIDNHREAAWALEAHTCKVGITNQDAALLDMYISRRGLDGGRIRFARLDACIEATYMAGTRLREDAPLVVNHCSDAPTQRIELGEDGRIRPAVDPSKCLTIGSQASEAGDRAPGEHWYRRPLTFSTCDLTSLRQRWQVSAPPPSNRYYELATPRPAPERDRQTWQTAPMPPGAGDPGEVLLRMTETLDEPRHYCMDIPGYPFTLDITKHREALWALEAHTCKTGIPNERAALLDMAMSGASLADGRIRFARIDACVEVSFHRNGVVREDSPMVINPCSAEPKQQMILSADGRIHPALDPSKCLTVHAVSFEAGERGPGEAWHRRPMTFSSCAA
jgi:hypothetical protein